MNLFEHSVGLREHFVIPETQHAKPLFIQPPIAGSIRLGIRMLATIELDDQFCVMCDEINNVWPDGRLSPESSLSKLFAIDFVPQNALCIRHVGAQLTRGGREAILHRPPPLPLPTRGRDIRPKQNGLSTGRLRYSHSMVAGGLPEMS